MKRVEAGAEVDLDLHEDGVDADESSADDTGKHDSPQGAGERRKCALRSLGSTFGDECCVGHATFWIGRR